VVVARALLEGMVLLPAVRCGDHRAVLAATREAGVLGGRL
jgi:hypothetical protein